MYIHIYIYIYNIYSYVYKYNYKYIYIYTFICIYNRFTYGTDFPWRQGLLLDKYVRRQGPRSTYWASSLRSRVQFSISGFKCHVLRFRLGRRCSFIPASIHHEYDSSTGHWSRERNLWRKGPTSICDIACMTNIRPDEVMPDFSMQSVLQMYVQRDCSAFFCITKTIVRM